MSHTRCALCTEMFPAEELDFVAVLPGPDVPVCIGCLGELHEVADLHNDGAHRAQVARGLAQEFGIEDVIANIQFDELRNMPVEGDALPWEQEVAIGAFFGANDAQPARQGRRTGRVA